MELFSMLKKQNKSNWKANYFYVRIFVIKKRR